LSSCEKENPPVVENTDLQLLSKVFFDDDIYIEYTYNKSGLPAEEKSRFHYSKHNYNDSNQLISSDFYWDVSMASSDSRIVETGMNRKEWVNPFNTPLSLIHRFEYDNDGEMIRKAYFRTSDNYPDIEEFLYENDKIIRSVSYYYKVKSGYTDYFYDDRGNLVRLLKYSITASGNEELVCSKEYELDNMKNPYYAFRNQGSPGKYTNPNNILKETTTFNFETDPGIQNIQVTNTSYEYDDLGYPVRVNGTVRYVYLQNQ
jgi:hypothetical protein